MKYSKLSHIWFIQAVSGRCCRHITPGRQPFVTIFVRGAHQGSPGSFFAVRCLKSVRGEAENRILRLPSLTARARRSGYAQSQKGVDGFRKEKGIKRQILVDAEGFSLLAEVTTANVHDSKDVGKLLKDMEILYPSVSLVKADKGYRGTDSTLDGCVVECVKPDFGTSEFRPVSGRWVVERTNSWLENYRRLCRNYERYLTSALAMTYLASILFMLRYC